MELEFIGDRSNILGIIITSSGIMRAKMTKMRQKLLKKLLEIFLYIFSVILLKFLRVID